jgi:hypothetical protein
MRAGETGRTYEDIGDGALPSLVEEVCMNIIALGYLVESGGRGKV